LRRVFADTYYWVALTDPREPRHSDALAAGRSLGSDPVVTTEPVLIEFLNFFSEQGSHWRGRALAMIGTIAASTQIEVLPYEPEGTFQQGLLLYAARPDKGYSLTDCIAMQAMRDLEIYEILTNDQHFAQEGFVLLLP